MPLIFAGAWPSRTWPRQYNHRLDRPTTALVVKDAGFRSADTGDIIYIPEQSPDEYRELEIYAPTARGGAARWQRIMTPYKEDASSGMSFTLTDGLPRIGIRPAEAGANVRIDGESVIDIRWADDGSRPTISPSELAKKIFDYDKGLEALLAARKWFGDSSRLKWPEEECEYQVS